MDVTTPTSKTLRALLLTAMLLAVSAFALIGEDETLGPIASASSDQDPAPEAPVFRLEDTGSHGSELNLGVTSQGVIFLGGWDKIARSQDDGRTWTYSTMDRPVGFAADRVLVVDKVTDRVYVDDTTLGCTILSWSDDLGQTWTSNYLACGGGATDHQKIAVGPRTELTDPTGQLYENIVYVCANGLTHTPCAPSVDGGLTFGPGMPSMQIDAEAPTKSQTTCAFQGVPKANQAGTLYQPQAQCGLKLWWSQDNALTWTHSEVDIPGGQIGAAGEDVPDVGLDGDTVYFFHVTADWQPQIVVSHDGGQTWSHSYTVAPDGLVSSLFPVITAGEDGRVGIAYYATTDDVDGWDHNPGNAPDEVAWHLYAATILEADTTTPDARLAQVTPEEDPIQYGPISKLGSNLNNIADYIDIDHGPDGRLYIGYVDGCPACQDVEGSTADDGYVAVQEAGPGLQG